MAVFITGISVLILFICQVNEARAVENAEINIQRDSLTRLTSDSGEISRNPRHSDGWSKVIQPPWKCKDGHSCDGEPTETIHNPKPCSGSVNCQNKIHTKILNQGKKDKKETFAMSVDPATPFSGFKRIFEVLVRKSPCPAENPRCERKRAVLTTRKISYQCPTGLWCAKKRNHPGNIKIMGSPTSEGNLRNDDTDAKIVCQPGFNCGNSEQENDDSSTKLLQGNKLDQGKEHCPIGLWCSPKREPGFESSDTLEKCPPGLWCKRNGIRMRKGSSTKRVNKREEDYQCPTGLWCAVKREEGYENFETLSHCPPGLWCKRDETTEDGNSIPQETDMAEYCPTGLWCTSKREVGYENSETLQDCPPGLWCKKNTIMNKDDNTELNDVADNCPSGFRCSIKRHGGYENSETLRNCPPGLWCKRSVQKDSDIFLEQRNVKRQGCPTGLWCALKRKVANIDKSEDCPPGLWCKRNGAYQLRKRRTARKSHGAHSSGN